MRQDELYHRVLPDSRVISVIPLTFGRVRLTIARNEHEDQYGYDASNLIEPGTLLFSGNTSALTRVATGNSLPVVGSLTGFQNDFSVPDIFLLAGIYWLGLHNGPLSTTGFFQFYWETTDPNLTTSVVRKIPFNDNGWVDDAAMSLLLLGTGLVLGHQVRRVRSGSAAVRPGIRPQ